MSERMSEDNNSGDETINPSHNKLLSAVSQLYKKQRVDAPKRSEPNVVVSEFTLSSNKNEKRKQNTVFVNDLAKVLNKRAVHKEISKKLRTAKGKSKVLPRPLETFHANKIARDVGYKNLRCQLSKWDAIVHRNRAAEQLKFPLREEQVKVYNKNDFLSTFSKPTELEQEMAMILNSSKVAQKEAEVEEQLFPLSVEEMVERRRMMAHVRAQESYRIAKAARQNKIKSKKYHRIQRQERMKKELKEFEQLQKTDPEKALEKLQQLEKARAEERATLRHRSTGQWARSKAVRAKYDKEARIELAEQLAKGRELTQKLKIHTEKSSSEGEDSENEDNSEEEPSELKEGEPTAEIDKFISGYRKFWSEKKKSTEVEKDIKIVKTNPRLKAVSDSEEEDENSKIQNNKEHPETVDQVNNSNEMKDKSIMLHSDTYKESKLNDELSTFNNLESGNDEHKSKEGPKNLFIKQPVNSNAKKNDVLINPLVTEVDGNVAQELNKAKVEHCAELKETNKDNVINSTNVGMEIGIDDDLKKEELNDIVMGESVNSNETNNVEKINNNLKTQVFTVDLSVNSNVKKNYDLINPLVTEVDGNVKAQELNEVKVEHCAELKETNEDKVLLNSTDEDMEIGINDDLKKEIVMNDSVNSKEINNYDIMKTSKEISGKSCNYLSNKHSGEGLTSNYKSEDKTSLNFETIFMNKKPKRRKTSSSSAPESMFHQNSESEVLNIHGNCFYVLNTSEIVKRTKPTISDKLTESINKIHNSTFPKCKKKDKELIKGNEKYESISTVSGNWIVTTIKTKHEKSKKKEIDYLGKKTVPAHSEIQQEDNKSSTVTEKKKVTINNKQQANHLSPSSENKNTKTNPSISELTIEEIFNNAQKIITDKSEEKLTQLQSTLSGKEEETDEEIRGEEKEYQPDLTMKKMKLRSDIDEMMIELADDGISDVRTLDTKKLVEMALNRIEDNDGKTPEIDPQKFLSVKPKHIMTQIPDIVSKEDEGLDDEDDDQAKQMDLIEAFAEDDIIDEFRKKKEEEVKGSNPKNIDLSLPGWGSWGGAGVIPKKTRRKKRRFVIKLPELPRKDRNKDNVIIREKLNPKLKEHLVNELPYPFTSVKDFEASVRAPIGRTWIPESAHAKLTIRPVITKMGKIIEPMDKKQLVKMEERKKKMKI